MGGDEHRRPLFSLLLNDLPEQHRPGGVQAASGLIQKQQPGIAHQRPGHTHPLAHPLGVGGHRLFQKVRLKFQRVQQLAYVPPLFLMVKGCKVVQVIHGTQIGVQIRKLKQHADFLEKFLPVSGGDILPEQRDLAPVALQNSGENLLRRGFPGAVGPQETEDFSVLYGEVQAVEGLFVFAVGERQVFDLDHSPSPHFPR